MTDYENAKTGERLEIEYYSDENDNHANWIISYHNFFYDSMITSYTTHPDEIEIHYNMGAGVEIIAYNHHGNTFLCGGCETPITIRARGVKNGITTAFERSSPLKAYPHDGGFEDSDGKKWWIFVHCSKCEYDTSMQKIPSLEKKYTSHLNIP